MRFILRLTILGLLILAIAGVRIPVGKRPIALAFVVDRSESVAPLENSGALENMNKIVAGLSPEDEVGIVAFGKDAVIEQRLQKRKPIAGIQSTPATSGTNIAKGLTLANFLLKERPDSSKQIILVSDGLQTSGERSSRALKSCRRWMNSWGSWTRKRSKSSS